MAAPRLLFIVGGLTLALAGTAVAAVSHVALWTTPDGGIACGIKAHRGSAPATLVLCDAALIPAPPGRGTGRAGYVQIGRTGRPQLLRLRHNAFAVATPRRMNNGGTWAMLGVRCTITTHGARCTNASGHGFRVSSFGYVAF
jgi:hypothetical protein